MMGSGRSGRFGREARPQQDEGTFEDWCFQYTPFALGVTGSLRRKCLRGGNILGEPTRDIARLISIDTFRPAGGRSFERRTKVTQSDRITSIDLGSLVLRVATGGLLLFHGIGKLLHGIEGIKHDLFLAHLPSHLAYLVYLGEIVAPILLVLGMFTRISAAVVLVDLLAAILLAAHARIFVIQRGGAWGLETEAFFLLNALSLTFIGGGRLSLGSVLGLWGETPAGQDESAGPHRRPAV